jgi:negative regulator of flagellin synthesis FlgM
MAIESISGRTRTPLTTQPVQKTEIDSGNKAAKQSEKSDSIAITGVAQGIKKAVESSASVDVVDVERVASVKKALAEGSYQINAEKIAKKMIQFEKLLPQGK